MKSLDSLITCPEGTKIWILHVGDLEVDENLIIRASTLSRVSDPKPPYKRRQLAMISVLIEHPTAGLILFETGGGKDWPEVFGPIVNDIFNRVNHAADKDLPAAIAKTGHDIKDVKAVIMGHLHLDHAGGLIDFIGTDTKIYVHETELKYAFHSVATGLDADAYFPTYLTFNLKWTTFLDSVWEIFAGLTIRHSPGHTPGLCILQINLIHSGTWIFTSDQYHVRENYEGSRPQGFLARDHEDWFRSHQMIQRLAERTDAKVVLGHDKEYLEKYKIAPESYD